VKERTESECLENNVAKRQVRTESGCLVTERQRTRCEREHRKRCLENNVTERQVLKERRKRCLESNVSKRQEEQCDKKAENEEQCDRKAGLLPTVIFSLYSNRFH